MRTSKNYPGVVDMEKPHFEWERETQWWEPYIAPATIGAYAVAGLYVVRALKKSTEPLPTNAVLMVAATSVAAAAISARALPLVYEEKADSAPLVEAAMSTAFTGAALNAVLGSESALMFAPIQFIAHFTGDIAAEMARKKMAGLQEESSA